MNYEIYVLLLPTAMVNGGVDEKSRPIPLLASSYTFTIVSGSETIFFS